MISTLDAAHLLGMSDSRVRKLCRQNRIPGARRVSGVWLLPNRPRITPVDNGPPLRQIAQ